MLITRRVTGNRLRYCYPRKPSCSSWHLKFRHCSSGECRQFCLVGDLGPTRLCNITHVDVCVHDKPVLWHATYPNVQGDLFDLLAIGLVAICNNFQDKKVPRFVDLSLKGTSQYLANINHRKVCTSHASHCILLVLPVPPADCIGIKRNAPAFAGILPQLHILVLCHVAHTRVAPVGGCGIWTSRHAGGSGARTFGVAVTHHCRHLSHEGVSIGHAATEVQGVVLLLSRFGQSLQNGDRQECDSRLQAPRSGCYVDIADDGLLLAFPTGSGLQLN